MKSFLMLFFAIIVYLNVNGEIECRKSIGDTSSFNIYEGNSEVNIVKKWGGFPSKNNHIFKPTSWPSFEDARNYLNNLTTIISDPFSKVWGEYLEFQQNTDAPLLLFNNKTWKNDISNLQAFLSLNDPNNILTKIYKENYYNIFNLNHSFISLDGLLNTNRGGADQFAVWANVTGK